MDKPVLYSYYRSSASWRVRTALAFKGIDYEYKAVNLVKDGGQQLTEEYKALNPIKQVPTLVIDGITLGQSMAILEYLEETRPEKRLLPVDPKQKAKVRQISEMINSGIQPIQNLSVLKMIEKVTGDESKKVEWAKHWITNGLQAVELMLGKTSGKYCVGDEVSFADLFLVPQMYNAVRFEVDLAPFPIIKRVVEECGKLDAFKKADANNQPDTPH